MKAGFFKRTLREAKEKENELRELESLIDIAKMGEELVRREKAVIEGEGGAVFIGDIHGSLRSLEILADEIERAILKGFSVVFLGDYVDRGNEGILVLFSLFKLKESFPERVILLRGNHEDPETYRRYGFVLELLGEERAERAFRALFSQLPLVYKSNELVAFHGGIPKIDGRAILWDELIGKLRKGVESPLYDPLLLQLLWNDPDLTLENFAPSPRGPGIYLFGKRPLREFLESAEAKALIRAHECNPRVEGFREYMCFTLFSSLAPHYAYVTQGRIFFAEYDPKKGTRLLEFHPLKGSKEIGKF